MRIFEKQGKKRAVVRFVRSVLEKDYYVFEKPEGEFFLREGKLLFSAKKGRYFPEKQVLILEDSVSCRMPFENLQWETEEMEIVMDKKEIRGKKGIHFQWGTMEVAGREWEMKVEEKRVVLSGGVKGIIAEKGGY
ncbi:MAG: LPS export ABC transporter periplasmic protein LptC [bacterium JZ-2024 1]